ncbi:MAG: saccharopine dehydrogenase C-terminal domain-containing protein [Planctomycetota bacterium]|nr:saccharopine dehydrogenase C-terminal domain-containing protein [Planctomycetota bacterium]
MARNSMGSDISSATFAVLGAGMMGKAIAFDLRRSGAKKVIVADRELARARKVAAFAGCSPSCARELDLSDRKATAALLRRADVAISAASYVYNLELTRLAIETKTHLCDLGGNSWVVDDQLALGPRAAKAGITVVPDCGLAPGLAGVVVARGFELLDSVSDVHIRVGGLPQNPKPPLDYGLLFSAQGLINEYVEKSRIVRNGCVVEVESLAGIERLSFRGVPAKLEAFYTSGGTSTLPATYAGRLRNLDYKTIRYRGHCERARLLYDLGLMSGEPVDVQAMEPHASSTRAVSAARRAHAGRLSSVRPRDVLGRLFETLLPPAGKDLTLVRVTVSGLKDRRPKTWRYELVDRFDEKTGLSSMMRTTGFPTSIIAQMIARGDISKRGVFTPERCVPPARLLTELEQRLA